jgi:hypothetical protein
MYFNNINFLWGLVAIPVMATLLWLSWRHYRRFEQSKYMLIFGHNSPSWTSRFIWGGLKLGALALLLFALAEPAIKLPSKEKKYENVRIFFLVDVSSSMVYAEDIKPTRMDCTKKEMLSFYDQLDGQYSIGIIPFAGMPNAYYCPVTNSRASYTLMTKKLSPNVAPDPGTDLPLAMESLQGYLKKNKLYDSGINIIVVMTDGGKEESESTNRLGFTKNITEMSGKNCKFFFVGIGGKEPAPLLIRDKKGAFVDFVRDEKGNAASSQLDEDFLRSAAEVSRGEYKLFDKPGELYPLLKDSIEKNRVELNGEIVYKQVSLQPYLFVASFVILMLCFIANRSRKWKTAN